MKKRKWIYLTLLVGALGVFGAQLLQPSTVWAGGAGPLVQSPTPKRHDYTDRLIIKLRDVQATRATTMSASRVGRLSAAAGVTLTHVRAMSGDAQVLKLPQRMSLAEAQVIARRLAADPQVEYAEPDRIMRPMLVPNDAQYANQWSLDSYPAVGGGANLPGAWDINRGNASLVVAVVDTGLVAHADIDSAGRVVAGYDFVTDPFTANDGDGRDPDPSDPGDWSTQADVNNPATPCIDVYNSSWHGTHVAGIIGAWSNNATGVAGINWTSKILPVRVLGKCGGALSDVVDGMRWAAGLSVPGVPANANPAKVLNLSLGSTDPCSITEQNAITEIITTKNATVVVAAGNEYFNAATSSPGSCNGVINVAAVNRDGGQAYYSNYGTAVTISAPGGEQNFVNDPNGILSTLNTGTTSPVASPGGDTYGYYQGTSMATPHVTGIVSLMLSLKPSLLPVHISSILQNTARSFPTTDCTVTLCGAGIIDASAAIVATNTANGLLVSSPANLNFGEIPVNQPATPQTITFTNIGGSSLTLTANATLSGTNAGDYSITGSTCTNGLVLAPTAICTVTVGYTPTAFGVRSASLVVANNATLPSVRVLLAGGAPPTVTVSATDAVAAEAGRDPGTFTITRTGDTSTPLAVSFTLQGTAINSTDYDMAPTSVTIPVGNATATVTITPIDDSIAEGNETVVLSLTGDPSYIVGSASDATITIIDNDVRSKLSGGGCFIATAAFGTPMAQDVRYLRAFRDEYLQTNDAGRWFVKQYYKYSPPLADYLRQHDDLRAVVRAGLSPLVGLSRAVVDDSAVAAETADRP
jgi:serine protease